MPAGYTFDTEKADYLTSTQAWVRVLNVENFCSAQYNLLEVCEQLGVCPEGLVDPEDCDDVLELEQLSETYHVAPTAGSLEDMPARLYDAFGVIRRTHVRCQNEALAAIRRRTQGSK